MAIHSDFQQLLTIYSFKVIIPVIVQRFVNNRKVELLHAAVRLQSNTEIIVSANASFDSPMPASVDNLQLRLHDGRDAGLSPFFNLSLDELPVSRKTTVHVLDKVLHVTDQNELVNWALDLVNSVEVPINVAKKDLQIKLGALHYVADLDKPIMVQGLRGLDTITLESVQLILPPVDGKNVKARISLENYSSLTIDVGIVTLDLVISDIRIGTAVTEHVQLLPGLNYVDIQGVVDIPNIIHNLGTILVHQARPLQAGKLEIRSKVPKVNMEGREITFVDLLLAKKTLSVHAPLVPIIDGVLTGLMKAGAGGLKLGDGKTVNISTNSVLSAVSEVFSNDTLMDRIRGHWDRQPALL